MITCNITLNVFESSLDEGQWQALESSYQSGAGWVGYSTEGIPFWFSMDENQKYLSASLEPSGLVFYGSFESEKEWDKWINDFQKTASMALDYSVQDAEL